MEQNTRLCIRFITMSWVFFSFITLLAICRWSAGNSLLCYGTFSIIGCTLRWFVPVLDNYQIVAGLRTMYFTAVFTIARYGHWGEWLCNCDTHLQNRSLISSIPYRWIHRTLFVFVSYDLCVCDELITWIFVIVLVPSLLVLFGMEIFPVWSFFVIALAHIIKLS